MRQPLSPRVVRGTAPGVNTTKCTLSSAVTGDAIPAAGGSLLPAMELPLERQQVQSRSKAGAWCDDGQQRQGISDVTGLNNVGIVEVVKM
jgi:hypothetical protein